LDGFAKLFAEKVNEGRSRAQSDALEHNRYLEIWVSDSVKRVHREAEKRRQAQRRDSELKTHCLGDRAAEELPSSLKEAETAVVEYSAELQEEFDFLEEQGKQCYDPVERNNYEVKNLEHSTVDSLHRMKMTE
jgi:hypothetical protein